MTEIETLVLPILKDLQSRMSRMENGLGRVHVEIAALGQQLAGLTTAVYSGNDRFAEIERRVERIEKRLELSDEN